MLSTAKTVSCHKGKIAALPSCMEHKIEALKAQPKTNPPAEILQYTYNGKTVYLLMAGCCDQYNVVYDDECNYLCAPSGGLTGKGDRKCTDFNERAKFIKAVWKDER